MLLVRTMAVKLLWLPVLLLHVCRLNLRLLGAFAMNVSDPSLLPHLDGETGGTPVVPEDHVPSPTTSSTSSASDRMSDAPGDLERTGTLAPPAPSLDVRQYDFDFHVETSADERQDAAQGHLHPLFLRSRVPLLPPPTPSTSSTSSSMDVNTSGFARVQSATVLIQTAVERLETHLWLGEDLQAQMLAQEIQRWATCHPLPAVRNILTDLNDRAAAYRGEGWEVGVVLTRDEGRWLQGLLDHAQRIAESSAPVPAPPEDEVTHLMQHGDRPSRSRPASGRSRRARSRTRPRHDEACSPTRTRRRPEPPTRPPWARRRDPGGRRLPCTQPLPARFYRIVLLERERCPLIAMSGGVFWGWMKGQRPMTQCTSPLPSTRASTTTSWRHRRVCLMQINLRCSQGLFDGCLNFCSTCWRPWSRDQCQ